MRADLNFQVMLYAPIDPSEKETKGEDHPQEACLIGSLKESPSDILEDSDQLTAWAQRAIRSQSQKRSSMHKKP